MESSTRSRVILPLAFLVLSSLLLFSFLQNREVAKNDAVFYALALNTQTKKPRPLLNLSPDLSAQAYLVKILGDGEILLETRKDKILPIASLTKLFTSLLVYERLDQNELIIISKEVKEEEEKLSNVKIGEEFLRDDAIKFAMIESDNDFALALAERVGGKLGGENFNDSVKLFVNLMNQRVKELGLMNSSFINPTGLDPRFSCLSPLDSGATSTSPSKCAPDYKNINYSTAEDLAKLAEYVWYNGRSIWDYTRTIEADITSLKFNIYTVSNTNDLLKEFPGILGGKTGLTDLAGENLLFLYPLKTTKIVVVVILKSENRFEDGRKIIKWLEEIYR